MATRQREEALLRYYSNPSICRCCGKVIPVKDDQTAGEIRKRKFCDHSCSAKHSNTIRTREKSPIQVRKSGKDKVAKPTKDRCLLSITKGELFSKRSSYQSARSAIQKHARAIFVKASHNKSCRICGYDKHVEVCHIKPVAEFPDSAVIMSEINNPSNLIGLCPTHHWEFDNGLLTNLVARIGFEPMISGL